MRQRQFTLAFFLFFTFICNSFANNLSGKWEGKDYSITLSDSFEYIRGSWGNVKFDLKVSESFQYIRGDINGTSIDLKFSDSFYHVRGVLPCGIVDYKYSTSFMYVKGILCGDEFEIKVLEESEVIPTAEDIFMNEILSIFPRPTQVSIRNYIKARIKL